VPDIIVQVRELRKSYLVGSREILVLRGINLAVSQGEFLAITGPSGCGKSTLLFHMGGMMRPTSGTVLIGDEDLARLSDAALTRIRRDRIGFVFQRFNLLPAIDAEENVRLALTIRGVAGADGVAETLDLLGLSSKLRHRPHELSMGEQQRVAIARAIIHGPDILLADEPTGNLDSGNADQILSLFQDLNRKRGQTIVMITHNKDAAAVADRVLQMKDGQILST
jgi:putative ABC transport system ATP-binding protein